MDKKPSCRFLAELYNNGVGGESDDDSEPRETAPVASRRAARNGVTPKTSQSVHHVRPYSKGCIMSVRVEYGLNGVSRKRPVERPERHERTKPSYLCRFRSALPVSVVYNCLLGVAAGIAWPVVAVASVVGAAIIAAG